MPSLKYLAARVRSMHFDKMREAAGRCSKLAHRPKLLVLCDMAVCGAKYGAGYVDYELFEFWRLNGRQRSSYLTRGINNEYVSALNSRSAWSVFDSKPLFLERFKDYAPRKWLDLTRCGADELRAFGGELGEFIAKPMDGTHGDGIEKIRADKVEDWDVLYRRLCGSGSTLCEELIRQHPDMDAICPSSVNTIRTVTLVRDGVAHIVAAYLRVGGGKRPVDNFNGGGMVAVVDRETGVILTPAVAKFGEVHDSHPITGAVFKGRQLPMWQQCRELVLRAALEMPDVRYVGWDVAITPDGPTFVEGNQYPGHDIYGLPAHSHDGAGVLPQWEQVYTRKELKRMVK